MKGMEDNHDDDDIRLEEEIEIELSKISISSLEADDPDTDLSDETSSDSEPISDELPESVLCYLNFARTRSQNAEGLLQEMDNDDVLSDFYSVVPNRASDCLVELASEYNEDPEDLKKRVLSEIEDEELQISPETENAEVVNNDGSILSNEIVDLCLLTDGNDRSISFSFQEVETRCKQEYELWLEQQKEVDDEKMKKLKEEREMEEMENEKEMDKRHKRQEELEAERMKLEMLHAQQQVILDETLQKEEEAWKEQLIQHKKLIQSLHMQIEEEQIAFEEQKSKEREQMIAQQNMAAQKIQASFRAFRVYKNYAPVLKEWRAELKRKRDLQEKIEREHREKEERLRRRALEKKSKEEERKKGDEHEREEIAERVKRHEGYERKKQLVRLQREQQLMLLQQESREKVILKGLNEWVVEPENTDKEIKMAKEEQEIGEVEEDSKAEEIPRRKVTENIDQDTARAEKAKEIEKVQEEEVEEEQDKTSKMECGMATTNSEEDLEISKNEEEIEKVNEQEKGMAEELKQILQKQHMKLTQETRFMEEKQASSWHDNGGGKQKSGKTEFLNEVNCNLVENGIFYVEGYGSVTANCQTGSNTRMLDITTVPTEISVVAEGSGGHSNHISMHVQLGSGDPGQTERSSVSGNIKREPSEKEIQDVVDDLWAKDEISGKSFGKPNLLSDRIEEKRLLWMKTCKSWSSICKENKKKKIVERGKPRKCSASFLPPLSASMMIQAGPWNALQQVTTVTFEDLPGCSLSTLSQCCRLQFLSLRCCGLTALEGLGSCKDLKYIDVEGNNIQTINCENLENLCILILNKNRISSIHGLYGCSNLWSLELSYNKITRIGGLESLKNLQRLAVDHNQLISTKGLSDAPTLIYIDCSFNHLNHIEGIENCGLLQILKLQGNNLSEIPKLENHVLLRELYLEDNSISTFEMFSNYWLPLLQVLSFSQNSLTHLAPLFSYVSLEKLDVSNNCLLDLKSVIQWLTGCDNLRELSLYGNPLLQEENWRCSLLKMQPNLKTLNGENIHSDADMPSETRKKKADPGSFEAFCQAQIKEINLVSKKATARLTCVDAVQRQCWYFKKLMKLSSEHRCAHEYGVLNATEEEEPEEQTNNVNQEFINITEKNAFFVTGAKENKQNLLDMPERLIASGYTQPMSVNSFTMVPGMGRNQECRQKKGIIHYALNQNEESKDSNVLVSPERNNFSKQIMASNGGNYLQHFDSSQNSAATIIQSYWRGYKVRKEINFYTRLHMAATVIQSFWRNYCVRKKTVGYKEGHHLMDKHKAATILQALWRGFHLRRKLASALAAVKADDLEDDCQEVNVNYFMFDDAVIQKEWPTLDSARFLSQTLLFSDQLPSPKANEPVQHEGQSHNLKWLLQKTSQFMERPNSFLSENSPISNGSEKSTLSQFSDLRHSPKSLLISEKEEQISAEWGFKDLSTAQLMLKRAHKMKAKKSKGKKPDPAVRLALFKNNENKHPPVKPPKKAQTGKTSYFEDKEEDFTYSDKLVEKMEKNKERTYQWLHTQVWDYEGPSPKNEKCKHFLPEIDPEVLKGGRVQLVTSPVRREDTDLELVSVTSGSTLTQNREKNNQPHRHSTGSPKKDAPAPERSQLGPSRKERISFRDHPVQLSGGWGSGKKKAKPLK